MNLVGINDVKFGDRTDSGKIIEIKIRSFEEDMAEALKRFMASIKPRRTCASATT